MTSLSRVELFRDRERQWRFRAVALNGETVAVSEGYENRKDALTEAVLLWPDTPIDDLTEEDGA